MKLLRVNSVKDIEILIIKVDINLLFVLDFVSGWSESGGGGGVCSTPLNFANHLLNAQYTVCNIYAQYLMHNAQCAIFVHST